jgi:YHS domain-containing protein
VDPIAKAILNSIKCPICQSGIDLLDWKDRSDGKKYNFCCSSNWEHYRNFFVHWEPVFRVEYETVVVYEGKHKYQVTQYEDNRTEIFIFKVDPEGRVADFGREPPAKFAYPKHLFDFTRTNRDKLVNRVKTILVFQ